jgi:uncharacterized membrane protein (UPF0127 family)
VFKNNKALSEPGLVNIVAKGKMHRENNELGNKDKGIPIINNDGIKEYEIEAGELVLRQKATETIEDLIKQYDETENDAIFEDIGKYLHNELINNTIDNYGKFRLRPKLAKSGLKTDDEYDYIANNNFAKVKVGNIKINANIPTTQEDMERGLIGTDSLKDGEGMLFKYDKPKNVIMTMSRMTYPIGMLFIKDGKVIRKVLASPGDEEIRIDDDSDMVLEISVNDLKKVRKGNNIEFIGKKNEDGTIEMANGGIAPKGFRHLLDETGKVQMNLLGGERVFSRISTKKMFEYAKAKKYKTLGRYLYKEIKAQEKRPVQYADN